MLSPGYPLLEAVADLGVGGLRETSQPTSLRDLIRNESAGLMPLLCRAPRRLGRIATLLEHGALTTTVRPFGHPEDVRMVGGLVNRALLVVMSLGLMAASVLLLHSGAPEVPGPGVVSVGRAFGWSGVFVSAMLFSRALLAVLRPSLSE